ncbi:MAG: hypothetical protein OXH97_08125 [Chloroflexota bacterium]|nr:hypothetical protein [Chloroflexota bacterium]
MSSEQTPDDTERQHSVEARLAELERRGELVRAKGPRKPLRPIATIPGALERFLAERGRSWEPYELDESPLAGSD